MKKKKYTSISLPPSTIHELDLWQKAYEEVGIKLTKEKLVEMILHNHRRFLWRDKDKGQEIVTNYKALKLVERDGIDLFDAYELVKEHDRETGFSAVYTRTSDYVYDREIYEIKTSRKKG